MKHTILKNISLNLVMKGITYLFSMATVMYATRALQPEVYGKASLAWNIVGYFLLIAGLGMPVYAMRCCAENRDDRDRLSHVFGELWSINFLLTLISVLIYAALIFSVPKFHDDILIYVICGSSILFQFIGCEWLFRGLERYSFLTWALTASKIAAIIALFILVHSPEDVYHYALISVFAGFGSCIICFAALRRYVDLSFRPRINPVHFKPILVFSLMTCAVHIYSSLDLTMLGFLKTDYETGLYSLVSKAKGMLTVLGGLVWTAALPAATRLWKEGKREKFETLAAKSLLAVCAIQSVLMIVCIIFAREIVLFIGGSEYLEAVPALRILLLSLLPIAASNILGGQVLIPAGKEKELLNTEIIGAVFNFLANMYFIPRYSIEGAAFTTLLSEVLVWIICLWSIKKKLGMDFVLGPFIKLARKLKRIWNLGIIRLSDKLSGGKLPFYCPCCGTHFKSFVNGGYDSIPDQFNPKRYAGWDQLVICPVCGALPRHRILALWMEAHLEIFEGGRMLHFAQEPSLKLWLDRHVVKYTTADLFFPADLKLDIEDTGLPESSWDVIVCNHVLEHVSDYGKVLRELRRILSPNGSLIISFPVDLSLETVDEDPSVTTVEGRLERFGQYDHLRVFGRDSAAILESFGFEVTAIEGTDFPSRIKPIIGPADYDYNVLWCLKPAGK